MINNSICSICGKRHNCPARDFDIFLDDLTGYVVECDLFNCLKQKMQKSKKEEAERVGYLYD